VGARLAFSPDGKALALAGGGCTPPRLLDLASGKELRRFPTRSDWITSLAFSADGKLLAAGECWSRVPRLWEVTTGKELLTRDGHRRRVGSLRYSSDGKTLFSSDGGVVVSWDTVTGKELHRIEAEDDPFAFIWFSPDGRDLVFNQRSYAQGMNKSVSRLLNRETGKSIGPIEDGGAIHFSPDQKLLAVRLLDDSTHTFSIRVLDRQTGKELRKIELGETSPNSLAFSPNGKWLIGGLDWGVVFWDVASGKELGGFDGDENAINQVAFLPNGRAVISAGMDYTVRVWDLDLSDEVRRIELPGGGQSLKFAISRDGKYLATFGGDADVRVWEVTTGKKIAHFKGHACNVTCAAFSPDGTALATGCEDTTILIWDLAGRMHGDRPPTVEQLQACWAELASEDAEKAFRARCRLALAPQESIPFLRKQFRPVPSLDQKRITSLIADLDSLEFAVRDKATKELEKLADLAGPACRKALESEPTAEVRRRLEALVKKQDRRVWDPGQDQLRLLRALEVLEMAGTPEARQLLETLAKGAPEARLTREAKAALERMRK
jgi:WD40 repeat protein